MVLEGDHETIRIRNKTGKSLFLPFLLATPLPCIQRDLPEARQTELKQEILKEIKLSPSLHCPPGSLWSALTWERQNAFHCMWRTAFYFILDQMGPPKSKEDSQYPILLTYGANSSLFSQIIFNIRGMEIQT